MGTRTPVSMQAVHHRIIVIKADNLTDASFDGGTFLIPCTIARTGSNPKLNDAAVSGRLISFRGLLAACLRFDKVIVLPG